ncbi:MAG TPA: YciI family protein [Mucilaginibacter sp.]|nr:YciI family protein [Mucilaginibacter sp.]
MKSNQFLLVFWREYKNQKMHLSPEKLQSHLKKWQEWLTRLAVNDVLASQIKRWDTEGRVLKKGKPVILGPYAEIKEYIDSLITIHAADYQEAKEIALGCPVLELGGTVEIRMAV